VRLSKTFSDFHLRFPSAHDAAIRNNLYDKVLVVLPKRTSGPYSKDEILSGAKNCTTRGEFNDNYPHLYKAARRRPKLDEAWEHMVPVYEHWTRAKILEKAKSVSTRTEFIRMTGAWQAAERMGMLDELEEILPPTALGNWSVETIRKKAQKIQGQFRSKSEFVQLMGSAWSAAMRIGMQNEFEKYLPLEQPGQPSEWTIQKILDVAKLCSNFPDFQVRFPQAFDAAVTQGLLLEVRKILPRKRREPYIKEEVMEMAQQCSSRTVFKSRFAGAFEAAKGSGIFEQACAHMIPFRISWTRETVLTKARNAKTRSEFMKDDAAKLAAERDNLIPEIEKILPATVVSPGRANELEKLQN
jgi:hypothetical protein